MARRLLSNCFAIFCNFPAFPFTCREYSRDRLAERQQILSEQAFLLEGPQDNSNMACFKIWRTVDKTTFNEHVLIHIFFWVTHVSNRTSSWKLHDWYLEMHLVKRYLLFFQKECRQHMCWCTFIGFMYMSWLILCFWSTRGNCYNSSGKLHLWYIEIHLIKIVLFVFVKDHRQHMCWCKCFGLM